MAGDIPTAEALMLERSLSVLNLSMTNVGISVVISWFNLKRLISLKFKSNSSLKSLGSWIKVNQMVDSTLNRTRDYSMAGFNSFTELSELAGSVSAYHLVKAGFDSQSCFVSSTLNLWFPLNSNRTFRYRVFALG